MKIQVMLLTYYLCFENIPTVCSIPLAGCSVSRDVNIVEIRPRDPKCQAGARVRTLVMQSMLVMLASPHP